MELRNLVTFIHVAELGSFTRAAEQLGYSQSTVSFQIKQLEDELGCLLFERINHTITLTERGRDLVSYAHKIRSLTDELKENLAGEEELSGHIHIVTPDSVCEEMINSHYIDFHKVEVLNNDSMNTYIYTVNQQNISNVVYKEKTSINTGEENEETYYVNEDIESINNQITTIKQQIDSIEINLNEYEKNFKLLEKSLKNETNSVEEDETLCSNICDLNLKYMDTIDQYNYYKYILQIILMGGVI